MGDRSDLVWKEQVSGGQVCKGGDINVEDQACRAAGVWKDYRVDGADPWEQFGYRSMYRVRRSRAMETRGWRRDLGIEGAGQLGTVWYRRGHREQGTGLRNSLVLEGAGYGLGV